MVPPPYLLTGSQQPGQSQARPSAASIFSNYFSRTPLSAIVGPTPNRLPSTPTSLAAFKDAVAARKRSRDRLVVVGYGSPEGSLRSSPSITTSEPIKQQMPRTSPARGRLFVSSKGGRTQNVSPSTSSTFPSRLMSPRREPSLARTSSHSSHRSLSSNPTPTRSASGGTFRPYHYPSSAPSDARSYSGPFVPRYDTSSITPSSDGRSLAGEGSNTTPFRQSSSLPRTGPGPSDARDTAFARQREPTTIILKQITVEGNATFGRFTDSAVIGSSIGNTTHSRVSRTRFYESTQ